MGSLPVSPSATSEYAVRSVQRLSIYCRPEADGCPERDRRQCFGETRLGWNLRRFVVTRTVVICLLVDNKCL
jgi:hypothetical protein